MLRGLSHVRRRVEQLATQAGAGRCDGYHRIHRVVHVFNDDPTRESPVARGGHRQAVCLWGRAGVPHDRASGSGWETCGGLCDVNRPTTGDRSALTFAAPVLTRAQRTLGRGTRSAFQGRLIPRGGPASLDRMN